VLPYEFRAKEVDEHQEEENIAEQNSANNEYQEQESIAEQCSVDEEYQSEEAQYPEKEEDKALEDYSEAEQSTVPITQLVHSPNVFKEVHLANNLLVFRFGQNFIVDASISKFLISYERPIKRDDLFVRKIIVTEHIGQHVVPFRKTGSDKLLQPKFSLLYHVRFIYTWVALLTSYLAYIWSQVRHVCYNYFDFRELKPNIESCDKADDSIIVYSKTSDEKCERQHVAEWDNLKSEPFGCLIPKLFSPQDRLENRRFTISLKMSDHIFDMSLKIDYIRILDHNAQPSLQGRIYCKLHGSFEHSIDNCNIFYQIVQSAVDKE
jgi:hypothetical protein